MDFGESAERSSSCKTKTETEEEDGIKVTEIAIATCDVAGAAALSDGGVGALFPSSTSDSVRKTMKAPGKDDRINRDDFERDPKSYFRNRGKKKAGMFRG